MRYPGLSLPLSCLIFAGTFAGSIAGSIAAQGNKTKVKLANMVTDAAGNASKLFAAAQFAKANKLDDKATELLEQIVSKNPDHKAANEALGHQFNDGKWQAEVEGIWVDVAHKSDAKLGIFHHANATVTAWEKKRLLDGYVRHQGTGELIAAADVSKANSNQFPLADGKWGDIVAADKFHSDRGTPWIIRTDHCYIVSTLPFNTIRQHVRNIADSVFAKLQMICGGKDLHPGRRPVVRVIPTTQMYIEFGDQYGGGGSSYGAFHTSAEQFTMTIAGNRRPVAAANYGAKGWEPYFLRHAAALAIAHAYFGTEAEHVPAWFHRALAGYSSRLYSDPMAKFFGGQHQKAGAPEDIGKWLADFRISGDNPVSGKGTNSYNIYQAGLLLKFCMEGGDQDSTNALMAVSKAISEGQGIPAAVEQLQAGLSEKTTTINGYLDKIVGS